MATFLKDKKGSSTKKILYLDQNMWIYLAQVIERCFSGTKRKFQIPIGFEEFEPVIKD